MKNNNRVVLEKSTCRQIVSEIVDFGISQNQIQTIIKLLALELEDRQLMLAINGLFTDEIEVKDKPQITL